jgi:lysozyme family protein
MALGNVNNLVEWSNRMNRNFDSALASVLAFEGGYVNDPTDHGGATNFGITQNSYGAYRARMHLPFADVKNISASEVADIYRTDYWLVGKCDVLPDRIDRVHFDSCVLYGPIQAACFLQKSLGVFVDGVIGPKTLATAASCNISTVVKSYVQKRVSFCIDLVMKDLGDKIQSGSVFSIANLQVKYLSNWVSRALSFV